MTTLNTVLTVSPSGSYTCNPPVQTVTAANTALQYTLDTASAATWQIVGLSTTDRRNQTTPPVIAPGGNSISTTDINTVAETFSVMINLKHRDTDAKHWIDPQVTNIPPG